MLLTGLGLELELELALLFGECSKFTKWEDLLAVVVVVEAVVVAIVLMVATLAVELEAVVLVVRAVEPPFIALTCSSLIKCSTRRTLFPIAHG